MVTWLGSARRRVTRWLGQVAPAAAADPQPPAEPAAPHRAKLDATLHANLIRTRPLTLMTNWHLGIRPPTETLFALGVEDATIILSNWWSVAAMEQFSPAEFASYVGGIRADAAAHRSRVVFFCNTPEEALILRRQGCEAFFAPKACLVDEGRFVLATAAPEFDAIYNAQFAQFKRHRFAAKVSSLLLVYGLFDDEQRERYHAVRDLLPKAVCANGDPFLAAGTPGAYRRLEGAEVAAQYRRAQVNLALSFVEGSMLASIEGLVSGLPVVSTKSYGGRDLFYTPGHHAMVADDVEAVAAAVAGFVASGPEPAAVRAATLEIVNRFREVFAEALCEATRLSGGPVVIDEARRLTLNFAHSSWYGLNYTTYGALLHASGYTPMTALLA